MAVDPGRRIVTYYFKGGWIRACRGLIDYLFAPGDYTWEMVRPEGQGKRPYGSRQRSNSAAGQVMFLRLQNGEVYTCRTNATQTSFLDEVIRAAGITVEQVWSERGTLYGQTVTESA